MEIVLVKEHDRKPCASGGNRNIINTNSMITNRRIVFLIGIFSLVVIIGLLIEINKLKTELEITKNTETTERLDTNENVMGRQQMKFDIYRVFAIPYDCFIDINEEKIYKASVGLCVENTEWEPFVVIGDSISDDGNLLGQLDTFYTDKGVALIEKEYFTIGEKELFGKYIVKFSEDETYTVLDFILSPKFIDGKDTVNTYKFIFDN